MVNLVDERECCGCSACVNVCPVNSILMIENNDGFVFPKVNKDKCVNCGMCTNVCPVIKAKQDNSKVELGIEMKTKVYAVYALDDEVRMSSSSGGVFSIYAKWIINNGGYVVGAAFNSDFSVVEHIIISDLSELDKLRRSKYVQSDINLIYSECRGLLESGKLVMFTGTPCQVEGLKSYLNKEYNNLYCVDLICHGVPSKKTWNKYLDYQTNKFNNDICDISFRNKQAGWKKIFMYVRFSNNTVYAQEFDKDLYGRAFVQSANLRESCYNCKFKTINRKSDITIGDFWRIWDIDKEMYNKYGTSAVIIQSEKGNNLFEKTKNEFMYKEESMESLLLGSPFYVETVKHNRHRSGFLKNQDILEFDELVKKYAPIQNRSKYAVKKILEKMGLLEWAYKVIKRENKNIRE